MRPEAASVQAPLPRPLRAVLISPYELGRQPFALAEPAAWLAREGVEVTLIDLSQSRLDEPALARADLVGLSLGMHTATRIALEALPRIRRLAPRAHLVAYGLYAPVNADLLTRLGVATVLGGECEGELAALARRLARGEPPPLQGPRVCLDRLAFLVPERRGLPPLSRYARLILPDGSRKTVGFVEASRGCKHLCRHCPMVPIYHGRFRVVAVDVVLADIRQQVQAGAQHVSFGDPDFFNGPTHALRVLQAMHAEFPWLTFDATIKIQHLVQHARLLPALKRLGCLFITSAAEAVDDDILARLGKNHTAADFERAIALTRSQGIALAPTFVAFTPWTTLEGYIGLLAKLVELRLVEAVPPVQLALRLLVPQGSYLLELAGFRALIEAFDPLTLGYPWRHRDPRVDRLQQEAEAWVAQAQAKGLPRPQTFARLWQIAHQAAGREAPALPDGFAGQPIPHLSEPWYCCAEPTRGQLMSI
jgi:radical SAM superfamily enzyme YgiQ (UPF0313 family)